MVFPHFSQNRQHWYDYQEMFAVRDRSASDFHSEVDVYRLHRRVARRKDGLEHIALAETENARQCLLCQSVLAELTADTGLLEATERDLSVERVRAVHPRGARVQPVRDPEGLVDVLAEDSGRKPVVRVVRLADDVVLVVELHDDADGPEDLLFYDLHVRMRVGKDRWLDEIAGRARLHATSQDFGALFLA